MAPTRKCNAQNSLPNEGCVTGHEGCQRGGEDARLLIEGTTSTLNSCSQIAEFERVYPDNLLQRLSYAKAAKLHQKAMYCMT